MGGGGYWADLYGRGGGQGVQELLGELFAFLEITIQLCQARRMSADALFASRMMDDWPPLRVAFTSGEGVAPPNLQPQCACYCL